MTRIVRSPRSGSGFHQLQLLHFVVGQDDRRRFVVLVAVDTDSVFVFGGNGRSSNSSNDASDRDPPGTDDFQRFFPFPSVVFSSCGRLLLLLVFVCGLTAG